MSLIHHDTFMQCLSFARTPTCSSSYLQWHLNDSLWHLHAVPSIHCNTYMQCFQFALTLTCGASHLLWHLLNDRKLTSYQYLTIEICETKAMLNPLWGDHTKWLFIYSSWFLGASLQRKHENTRTNYLSAIDNHVLGKHVTSTNVKLFVNIMYSL